MLWMQQALPEFGETIDPKIIANVLSIHESNIDTQWPVGQVSTGIPFIIVPLKDLKALKRVKINHDHYEKLLRTSWAKAILVFSPEVYDETQDLGVRVFPVYYGIPEDAATGSGNGCLAAYLVKNRYFGTDTIDIKAGQGVEMGRPSQIYLRAKKINEDIEVSVGGRVISIAEGEWG
jgi:trans-2,3-dihydro-3-hydroxyanthranilate isomerase